jgi:membrane-associated protein
VSLVSGLINALLHFDDWLVALAAANDETVYIVLFAIIFLETGLVIAPFLPGDSLLFAAGALAAAGSLDMIQLAPLLLTAAVAGDAVNYWAGRWLADRVLAKRKIPLVNQGHLERTQEFYRIYGASIIVAGRFAPIARTFAPFVAGVGRMSPTRFTLFNLVGAAAWVGVCLGGGYLWGDLPIVRDNFALALLGVVAISMIPPIVSWLWARRRTAAPGELQG